MRRMQFMTWASVLVAPGLSPLLSQQRPDPIAVIDSTIEKARKDFGIPGMAVAIVRNDSVVFAKGFGVREAGKPDPVDARTLFAIGSNTKSFTSTAMAMLVSDGKVHWNDRVTKWLPGFQLYDPYVTRELTIEDVLSHRSGLGRRGDMLWYGSTYSRDEVIRRIRYLPPNAPLRTEMGYSNIMFSTGGQIVAAVSGMSYDEFVRKRIFEPLGMTTSVTSVTELSTKPDVATPHSLAKGVATPIPHRNLDNVAPAGSIYSSAAEIAQYLRFQLGRGTYNGTRLVSGFTLDRTWIPHVNAGGAGDSVTSTSSYGMGWVLLTYRGHRIAWHNGGIDGMLSEMWTLPDDKIGVTILTNGSPQNMGNPLVMQIIDQLIGAPKKDRLGEALAQSKQGAAAQELREKATAAERQQGTHPALPLDRYAGTYKDEMYGDLTIGSENGKLVARFMTFTAELEHWHFNTFKGTWKPASLAGGSFINFQLDTLGKVAKAEVEGVAVFTRDQTPEP
ncbi:MAG: serine hydrolase [Gemmatimonadota bacterium]